MQRAARWCVLIALAFHACVTLAAGEEQRTCPGEFPPRSWIIVRFETTTACGGVTRVPVWKNLEGMPVGSEVFACPTSNAEGWEPVRSVPCIRCDAGAGAVERCPVLRKLRDTGAPAHAPTETEPPPVLFPATP